MRGQGTMATSVRRSSVSTGRVLRPGPQRLLPSLPSAMIRSYAPPAMRSFALAFSLFSLGISFVSAAEKEEVIPHAQSAPPGPALTPEQALAKMTVPEGFSVELVAAEPQLMNPVAMAFDARGRIWVTESFEYPRKEAGEG